MIVHARCETPLVQGCVTVRGRFVNGRPTEAMLREIEAFAAFIHDEHLKEPWRLIIPGYCGDPLFIVLDFKPNEVANG